MSRVAAVAVSFSLTGAPGIADLLAPEAEHRCTCRTVGGVHTCACARCHAAAARRASEERSPSCHGARPGRPAPAPDAGVPYWTGSCGAPEPVAASPLALQPFTLPDAERLPAPPSAACVTAGQDEPQDLLLSPDPPPPRAASRPPRLVLRRRGLPVRAGAPSCLRRSGAPPAGEPRPRARTRAGSGGTFGSSLSREGADR